MAGKPFSEPERGSFPDPKRWNERDPYFENDKEYRGGHPDPTRNHDIDPYSENDD